MKGVERVVAGVRRRVNGVRRRVASAELPAPTEREAALVEELRAGVATLPPVVDGEGDDPFWNRNRRRLRALVQDDDPRSFLRWDVVLRTMFVDSPPYVAEELRTLRAEPTWQERWRPLLREDPAGRPLPCTWYWPSSGNLIHHAFHLREFERVTVGSVGDWDHVVEIGGGYGSFCRLARRAGFDGSYTMLDLPEFSLLQRFYLGLLEADRRPSADRGPDRVLSDPDQLLARVAGLDGRTLLVATWSLSEAPLSFRARLEPLLDRVDGLLVAYQERWGDVDNVAYFDRWMAPASRPGLRSWAIPHLPGNRYLVGPT